MESSYVGAVVISGLVIVFIALILLIIAVTVMGRIFKAIKESKAEQKAAVPVKEAAQTAVPVQAAKAPASAAPAPEEDDTEIIAVIAAAVAAMSEECGVPLKIRSIKRAGGASSHRGGAWSRAARNENTRVF